VVPERWRRPGQVLVGALLALSAAILVYPEHLPRALLPVDGIVSERGFTRTDVPTSYEARESIRKSPALATWRNWEPARGTVPGTAHSRAFRLPKHLVVPYAGFAGQSGNRLYVECIASKATLDVAIARTNTQWSEAVVSPPRGWCPGEARLVASGPGSVHYVAFGTPYRIGTVSWLKTRFFGLLSLFVLLFGCVAGACLLAAQVARRRLPEADPLVAGFVALGVLGFAFFFAFQAGRVAASLASVAVSLLALRAIWRFHREPGALAAWRLPLAAWFCVALFCFALLHAADNGAGAWLANARFSPVRWSSDNQLPMLAGEYLVRKSLAEIQIAPWLVSDRTPLSYGLHAWLRATSLLPTLGNDGNHLAPQIHGAIGIIINTIWVPIAVHLLASLGFGARRIVLAVAMAGLLPFCLFNSIYAWPKLLGGAFGLLALWVLLLRDRGNSRQAGWVAAAALSALALLSHGGTLFGILAMLLFALFLRGLPPMRTLLACAAVVLALLGPWTAWQKLVQPPGNALVKQAFAGTFGWDDPPGMGVLATVQRSYARIDAATWLRMKVDGLRSLALPPEPMTCSQGEMAPGAHGIGAWRVTDFIAPVPSLRFLWLGLLVLPGLLATAEGRKRARPALVLLGCGLAGVGLSLLLTWDCHIIHTQSYQSLLAIVFGLLVLLLQLGPRWLGTVAAPCVLGYGLLVWVLDPLRGGFGLDPVALAASALLLLLPLLAWRRTYNDGPTEPSPSQ